MTQPSFEHLARYNPKANTADFHLPIKPRLLNAETGALILPKLIMRNAGQANAGYFNAVARANAKTGQMRRIAQGRIDAEMVERNRQQDVQLFPRHVIEGWEGIYDSNGNAVEFNADNCTAFLAALPPWIMDEIRNFAAVPANFLGEDELAAEDVEETAKN